MFHIIKLSKIKHPLTQYGLVGNSSLPFLRTEFCTKLALVLGDINVLDFIHKTI